MIKAIKMQKLVQNNQYIIVTILHFRNLDGKKAVENSR